MKTTRRHVCMMLMMLAALPLLLGLGPADTEWTEPGNTDINILNGGVMLTDNDDFYFNQNGIFLQRGESVIALSADDGRNLNLVQGKLYYTVGKSVYRIPASGGARETVHTAAADIKQLYVMGERLVYIAGGNAYSAKIGGSAERTSSLEGVMGLIPTPFGNLYLTGEVLNYTLCAEGTSILQNVQSCYTDNGYLAVQINNQNYMAELSALFSGFNKSKLEAFAIHGNTELMTLFAPDDENTISEYNENYNLVMDFEALLESAGLVTADRLASEPLSRLFAEEAVVIPEVSQGQRNMVKRARQLHEIEWTPLENRSQWGGQGTFYAETTYTGLPYGQPVNSNGYIGYGVTLEKYASVVLDNTSIFYTSYSTYNKTAPVYSTDCSGYVSYAWGLSQRRTTYTIPNVAEKVSDQSLYSIQIGDALNKQVSHVVLISDVRYDAEGNITWLEVMEQTPVITKLTRYGAGETRSLASFQSYYLNGGYVIYRNPERDSVTYTPNPAVPLDGETAPGQKDKAPKSKTTSVVNGKTVELYSDVSGAVIYYTLDGSAPTTSSARYTGPITFNDTTKLRAIAYTGMYSGSTILEYTVKVPLLATPTIAISEGSSSGKYVAAGSKVSITSVSGATIYYTLNGSAPTTSSSVYSGPITLNADTTVKAIAVAAGYRQSAANSMEYIIGKVYTITASAGSNGSVSPSGASSVVQTGSKTYTITANNGYKVDSVLVDGKNVGAVTSYTFSDVNANHTISAAFISASVLPFTDVKSGAWYYDAVSYVYASSLFNGTSSTTFSPETTMTRGMFVTVLGRFAGVTDGFTGSSIGLVTAQGVNIRKGPSTDTEILGLVSNRNTVVKVLDKSGDWYQIQYGTVTGYIRSDLMKAYSANYSDLSLDQYYSVYVQWAYLTGIANGVAGSSFNPDAAITREDMCLLLYNYLQIYGKTMPKSVSKTIFPDEAQMGASAKTAIYELQQAGVINGMGDGTFSPKSGGTRSQVAQIFSKYASAVK